MWIETPVFKEDMEQLACCACIPWDALCGKTVFVTGATGLIGYTLTSALLYYNQIRNANITVVALVRNLEQATQKYSAQIAEGCKLILVQGSVEQMPEIRLPIDYIVHGACPTAGKFFTEHPVETIETILTGTKNVLELAKEKQVSGMVYLSSMEVYGEVTDRRKLPENALGALDLSSPRSSYPEGKRVAEALCSASAAEYGVPVVSARLAQTFGPGVAVEDGRVFAYLARCAIHSEDICLHTSGSKENMYLYTADAAAALLLLLVRGRAGLSYNVGNPKTYCSVKELAQIAADTLGNGNVSVRTNVGDANGIYPPESYLNLDTSRITELGWTPNVDLPEMFRRMADCFKWTEPERGI